MAPLLLTVAAAMPIAGALASEAPRRRDHTEEIAMRGVLSGPGRLAAAAAVTMGLMLSACGSTGTNSSATGAEPAAKTTPAATGRVAQAKAQVAKYTADQPAIKIPALSKQPPKGIAL